MDAWRLSHSTNRTVEAVHLCDQQAVFWYDLAGGWDERLVTADAVFSAENRRFWRNSGRRKVRRVKIL